MLAQQILHGAEIDVFLSANERYIDELARVGAVDSTSKVVYAQGRIALWSAKKLTFKDLRTVRHLAIANPEHAPYGQAAKEALVSRGIWEAVRNRAVYGENVRQALQFAQTGNADAAVVAWSLVKDKGGELLPLEWHKPILQTAAIPVRSGNKDAARRLLTFLLSPQGQKLLVQHGFSPAPTIPQTRPASPAR
jgi:molybdate transport system substrate-binding protein